LKEKAIDETIEKLCQIRANLGFFVNNVVFMVNFTVSIARQTISALLCNSWVCFSLSFLKASLKNAKNGYSAVITP
jgi:hypothetical protein